MLTVILSFMLVFSVLLSSSSMVFAEETVLTENIIEQEVSDSLTDDMISDGESDENISDSISETQEMQEVSDSLTDDMISVGESDENISDSISETQEMQEVPDSSSDDMISDGESDENFSDGISETLENRINALPIIYRNGTHYIEDPEYPDEIITLFCMNNKLHWPHHTNDVGRILRTFKIKKNVEVTDNGKIII